MSVTNKYMLHTVVIGATPVTVNQLKDIDVSPNIARLFEYGSGSVDPTFAGFDGETPIVRFSTTAIKKLLAKVSVTNGFPLSVTDTCTLIFQQIAAGGSRMTAASSAWTLTMSAGLACISGISAQDGGVANCEAMVYPVSSDGETATMVIGTNAGALTLGTTDELYTIGPMYLNNAGSDIGAIESIQFDPKINVRRNRGDGQAYPTYAYIARRGSEQGGPTVRVTSRHLQKFTGTTIPITASTRVFLRSLKNGSTRELLATAKHIKIETSAGGVTVENVGGRDGDEASITAEINGTGSPAFTITPDVAIA